MELRNHQETLIPAMQLIKRYAPDTYRQMENTYWPVTLVADAEDFDDVIHMTSRHQLHPYKAAALVRDVESALGVTLIPENSVYSGPLTHRTWLNWQAITEQAERCNLNRVASLATVIVHEWTHRHGDVLDEAPCYAAGARFARAAGYEDVARIHEETGQQEDTDENLLGLLLRLGAVPVFA